MKADQPAAATPRISLYLLGTFRVERDARPIRLPTREVEALLAYLVLHPEAHTREKLAALLWGDSPDEQARGSLRKALTLLRTHLGDAIVLADRETIQINPDCLLWMDALEFSAQAGRFLAQAASTLEAVNLELYRGDLLVDLYEDWVLPWRESVRNLHLRTLTRLIQQAGASSDYSRAVELAQMVLTHDPENEAVHQSLMLSYLAIEAQCDAAISRAHRWHDACFTLARQIADVHRGIID